MPEYPDISVYITRLNRLICNKTVEKLLVVSPFIVRTFEPAINTICHLKIIAIKRMGKRLLFIFENESVLVIHLMIAGRFQWKTENVKANRKLDLLHLYFSNGTLVLTEAGTKKRASVHLFANIEVAQQLNPGGLEVLDSPFAAFKQRMTLKNHTLKRALSDPRILSGIGNAYSDEILLDAHLSPVLQTHKMDEEQLKALYKSIRTVLPFWANKLETECKQALPKKVTAFHRDMGAHGKFGQACPQCASTIQRIRYSANETNYCPTCQTGGRLLADRSLSRLLKSDWPKTAEELDEKLKDQ